MRNSKRIEQIQSKVRAERQALAEIGQKIADEEVRKVLLGPASLRLDQVEEFFLGEQVLNKPRSEANLSRWLAGADRDWASPIKGRAKAEATIQNYSRLP